MKEIFCWGLKWLPLIMSILLILFNSMYWSNFSRESFTNNVVGTSFSTTVFIYVASAELHFCRLHQHFIIFDGITSLWLDVRKIVNPLFGIKINLILVIIWFLLTICLIIQQIKKRKKPGH